MTYLKNQKAWTNFARSRHVAMPKEFPCLAVNLTSAGCKYLYADDIFKLAMKFRAEIQP